MKQNKFNKPNPKYNDFLSANQVLIYGKHPVFAALLNKNRKIYQILTTKNSQTELENFITNNKIINYQSIVKISDNDYINSILPQGSTHQGLVLKSSPTQTIPYQQFFDQINNFLPKDFPKLLILDNLTDPHNIGAIIRSAVAFGFKNIAVSKRNFPLDSPIIAKSACGMLEITQLIVFSNLNNFLANLKKIGYWRIGLDGDAKADINIAKNYQPIALVLGGESEGIHKLVKENCDLLIKISVNQEVESLNVSNAAAIAMYEISK
jgi:23S rRNA (guanosine2251-2'-O)-methyltransferase